jgi:hypothetical protein
MGVQIELDVADAPMEGSQPPLVGTSIVPALIQLGRATIPGTQVFKSSIAPADLTFVWGDVPASRGPCWRVSSTDWAGAIQYGPFRLSKDSRAELPFGPLAAAALAAGEVFKHVVRRLPLTDEFSRHYLEPARYARFDFGSTNPFSARWDLGQVAVISAGAISQAALYTLFRIPQLEGSFHSMDADSTELSNLNRNVLSTIADIDVPKVQVVANQAPRG